MKKYFVFILSVFLFVSVPLFAQPHYYFQGLGTINEPYEIWTLDDLMVLGDSIDAFLLPHKSTWQRGKHFRLMSNIDTVKQLICTYYFEGHFYGNGKTITGVNALGFFSGLYRGGIIDSLTVDCYTYDIAGIVGYVAPAHYMNLHPASVVSNCTSNVTINAIHNIAGGIAFDNSGIVINCVNNGSIMGVDRIGGIVGDNYGTVNNCLNTGRITATNWTPNSIFSGVGGIVGTVANGCTFISNNVNTGSIKGVGHVGGIAGMIRGNSGMMPPVMVVNNSNYGFVKGANRVGGLIGWVYAAFVNITNNSNFGVVVGEEDTGCIVGKNNGGNISNNHYDKQMCGE